MSHRIAVSIINYKTAEMTQNCAQSALDDMAGHDGIVVITDNASGDGSAKVLSDWVENHPDKARLHLVLSQGNTGFSGGHNIGIGAVKAEYYLLLNSDALVRPGFFDALDTTMRAEPKAGLIAPAILDDDGHVHDSCFRFHSPLSEVIRAACTGPVTRILKRYEVSLGSAPDLAQIQWVSFACVLLHGDMVRQLGPMDEGYFLYFEDAEYCLRARRAGWGIALAPQAQVVHFRGGSGPVKALAKAKKRMPAYFYASRTRFFRQAHGAAGPLLANIGWYVGRLIAQLRWLTGRSPAAMNAAEARDIWINIRDPLGPRRAPGDTG